MAPLPGREKRPITVLFADIVDSTAMAEVVDPEDWSTILNGVFDLMVEAVGRYGGTVAQFLGDGILAFFGAPVAHEDDAHRAVSAALAMLESAKAFSGRLEREGGPALRIRVGINTGPVILGHVGNLASSTYSAVGDTLNTAARIQAAAAPSSVSVTHTTYRLVSGVFDAQDLGRVQVKGKSAPVHCYRITALRGASESSPPRPQKGVVGRDPEIARLQQLLAALAKGHGGVVFVVGEPGIGKSRLIREGSNAALTSGALWLEGRAPSYGGNVPYGLVLEVVRSLFGTGLAAEPAEATRAVRQTLEGYLGNRASEAFPYIANLLSIPYEGGTAEAHLDPEAVQQRYVDSLTALLESAAARQPLVVVCEDVHWADAASAALLSRLLPVATRSRTLFLFSIRKEPRSFGWRLLTEARDTFGDGLAEIRLDPLSPAESAAFASELYGGELPASLASFLYEVTEGNPLFIEEVIRSYASADLDTARGEAGLTKAAVLEGSYSLHSLLLASIDRLPEDCRRLLKVASVIGREFSVELLTAVTQRLLESPDVARLLALLEASGLIVVSAVSPELQYSFRHALLQEAAYGSLLKAERRTLHAATGQALETVYPVRSVELAGLLAQHFVEAGDDERTLRYSILAADDAFRRFAASEAAVHYARALDFAVGSPEHADDLPGLFVRLGRSLELTDRYDEAVATYSRARDLGKRLKAASLELAGLVAGATALVTPAGRQDILEAEGLARRALHLSREVGDRASEGRSLWNLMLAHNFSGRSPDSAIEFGEQALRIARELGSVEQVASTLLDLHWSYLAGGRIAESFASLDEAVEHWRRLGDKAMLADSLACSSGLKLFVGDLGGAVADGEASCAVSDETGSLWGQSFSRMFLGYAFWELGRPEQAIEVMTRCVELAELSNTAAGQIGPRADLGWLLARTGDPERGLALAEEAAAESKRRSGAFGAWASAALARIYMLLGRLDEAAEVLRDIGQRADAQLFLPLPVRFPVGLARAELAEAEGDHEGCAQLCRHLTDESRRLRLSFWLPEAGYLHGLALSRQDETQDAVGVLRQSIAIAEKMGAVWSARRLRALLDDLQE